MSRSILLLLTVFLFSCESETVSKSPNVVYILIDDLGWADIGCYGSTFHETPNIDALAAAGMLFTDAYTAGSVCSPSRASIMTGKHPARLKITDWIPGSDPKDRLLLGPQDEHQLALEEETLAEVFSKKGYETAFIGKWHLGDEGFYPEDQGFDINRGGHWAGQPASFFYPYKNDRKRWDVPHTEGGKEGEYLTDRHTGDALQFIENHRDDPFFLMLSHYAVHTPIQAKEEYVNEYEDKLSRSSSSSDIIKTKEGEASTRTSQNNPTYAAMVKSVDESVGEVMKKLEELELLENTIIVFTSDNGGLSTLPDDYNAPTSVLPLRAGKGWLYEGGIRVPLIVSWEGQVEKSSFSNLPVQNSELFQTLVSLTGNSENLLMPIDGRDLSNIILHQRKLEATPLYWHFPHYHGSGSKPSSAMRKGDYKLVYWYEDERVELFDLSIDLSESKDISDENPQVTTALLQDLTTWKEQVGAKDPIVNPNYK